MAELTSAAPIPARVQLAAIAWLRWRMFANSFARRQSGPRNTGSLVMAIVLRLILWPIFALWGIGPVVGCGFLAWMAVSSGHPQRLLVLLAGVAVGWQMIALNAISISANMSSFDPASLLRFPLPFPRYLLLRLALGLMTATTIVGTLALFAAAIGIGIAHPAYTVPALIALGAYAAMNIFFARMIAIWLERWLSTRRAREIFAVVLAMFFLSFQFFNLRRPGGQAHSVRGALLLAVMHASNHVLQWLPPGFAVNAIVLSGHPLLRLAQFAALLAWAAVFFAAFAVRLRKQYLGEYLSEGFARSAAPAPRSKTLAPRAAVHTQETEPRVFSPTVAACLRKEFLYLRGNANQILGLLTPLIFVFILSRGFFAHHPAYLLSGSVGYAIFGLLAGLYNIFGTDGAGVQLYLLAPVRLRDVILAKNITSLTVMLAEAVLAWCLVLVVATAPIPASAQIAAAFWVVFVIGINLTVGTLRSIQAPRKFTPGQVRQMRTPTNRTSGLMVLALLFGSILLQVPVTLLCRYFHQPWLAAVIFAPLAAAAVGAYALLLHNADRLILTHRDLFAEELCSI
ncbi:MAG TPA: hypothetical protein VF865_04125 [Acidobacteriaceae bacterium]